MDVEFLARLQFALTIMFHYIYPPLNIGLGLFLVIVEALYLKTGQMVLRDIGKFWTHIFSLIFAIGVTTGIVMQLEFGTNWSRYVRFVGDVFGTGLAAEGIFAFFIESGFLSVLLFGWDRVSRGLHFFATLTVCVGAHFSALWIVVANCWMQTPAGYVLVGEGSHVRAHITSFWEMLFNPSMIPRLSHVLLGCHLSGAFFVISVSAYYLLKRKHRDFAIRSMKIALLMAVLALPLQLLVGDIGAKLVARYQPSKFAAMEGVYKTEKSVSLYIMGLPDSEKEAVQGIAIPKLLSLLIHGDPDSEIIGLDHFPKKDWPRVSFVFTSYHLMLYCFGIMVILAAFAAIRFYRGTLEESPFLLKCLALSVLLPQIANQAGWVTSEMGRYPWIVYNLLRIDEGLSKSVGGDQIFTSLILFAIIYTMLFALFLYLVDRAIKKGPHGHLNEEALYGQMSSVWKEGPPHAP